MGREVPAGAGLSSVKRQEKEAKEDEKGQQRRGSLEGGCQIQLKVTKNQT